MLATARAFFSAAGKAPHRPMCAAPNGNGTDCQRNALNDPQPNSLLSKTNWKLKVSFQLGPLATQFRPMQWPPCPKVARFIASRPWPTLPPRPRPPRPESEPNRSMGKMGGRSDEGGSPHRGNRRLIPGLGSLRRPQKHSAHKQDATSAHIETLTPTRPPCSPACP